MVNVVFNGSKSWAHNLNDLRERWSIRRENPINYEVPVNLFKQDISKMSKDDLLSLLTEIKALRVKVQLVLEKMKANWWKGKERHTDEEYLDVLNTDKAIGQHIQEISLRLAKFNNEYKTSLSAHFFNVCREKLSREQFSEIMDEANVRAKGKI